MRLVDTDKIYPDVRTKRGALAISQGQLAYAPTVEAIPKAEYEARLKADLAAMLDKIRAEIEQDAFKDVCGSKFIFVNRINQILDKCKSESEET